MLTDLYSVNNKIHNQSNKYNLINTNDVLDQLIDKGWTIASASERYTRNLDNLGKQFHIIKLENPRLFIGNNPINLVFSNSHDGKYAAKFRLGLFRTVCSNGLVVGDEFVKSLSIPHNQKRVYEAVDIASSYMIDKAADLSDVITLMKKTILNQTQQQFLAKEALKIKGFSEINNYQINSILDVNRQEDLGNDLWHVYNTVQESVENGLYMLDESGKARKINSEVKKLDFNTKLFNKVIQLVA